jgi:uncharacterized protein
MSDATDFGIAKKSHDKLLKLFASLPQIERVIIFGSRAMATHKTGSDIDLTMIGEQLDTSQLTRIMFEIDALSLPYSVDLSILVSLTNESLLDHISRVGKDFYLKQKAV